MNFPQGWGILAGGHQRSPAAPRPSSPREDFHQHRLNISSPGPSQPHITV
ncbi:MAG TPA: hypothetical protein V6C88_06440 [Chroococcidiopsis sp.]